MSDTDIRTQIIEVSENIFAKYGYKKANLEDIASSFGKGKSFIYYYFKSKEDIFEAVLEKETRNLLTRLSGIADTNENTRKKLNNFILVKAWILREVINYASIIKEEYFTKKESFSGLRADIEKKELEIACRIFQAGIDSGEIRKLDPEWAAESFLSAMKGFEFPLLTRESFEDIETRADALLDLLFNGIASKEHRDYL